MINSNTRKRKLQAETRQIVNGYKEVPSLHLAGVWLEKLGFKSGQTVNIITRDELLVIEPLKEETAQVHEQARQLKQMKNRLKQLL